MEVTGDIITETVEVSDCSKLLIKNIENPNLAFVLHLAKIKNVEICIYDTMDYECITLLK